MEQGFGGLRRAICHLAFCGFSCEKPQKGPCSRTHSGPERPEACFWPLYSVSAPVLITDSVPLVTAVKGFVAVTRSCYRPLSSLACSTSWIVAVVVRVSGFPFTCRLPRSTSRKCSHHLTQRRDFHSLLAYPLADLGCRLGCARGRKVWIHQGRLRLNRHNPQSIPKEARRRASKANISSLQHSGFGMVVCLDAG